MLTGDKDRDMEFKFESAMDRLPDNMQQWVRDYVDWRVEKATAAAKDQPREGGFTGRIDQGGGDKGRY